MRRGRVGVAACLLTAVAGVSHAEPETAPHSPTSWIEIAAGPSVLQATLALERTVTYWPWTIALAAGGRINERLGFGVSPWLQLDTADTTFAVGVGIAALAEYRLAPVIVSGSVGWAQWTLCCGFQGDSDSKATTTTIPLGLSVAFFSGPIGGSLDLMMSTIEHRDYVDVERVFSVGARLHLRAER